MLNQIQKLTFRSRRLMLPVAIGIALTTAAGCGSAAAASKSTTSGTAKGKALTFALVNTNSGAIGAFPEAQQGLDAAVSYINKYMGGIDGRPVKVDFCPDDGTPAVAGSCTTKLLQKNPVAFFGGADFGTSAIIPLLTKAKKAYLGGLSFGGPEATSKLSFQWNNTVAIAGTEVPYAVKTLHAKHVSLIYATGNGAALLASQQSAAIAENLGVPKANVQLISFDPSSPDLTAPMRQAYSGSDGVIIAATSGPQCLTAAQAHQELDIQAALFLPSGCFSTQTNKEGGSAYDDNVYAGGSDAQPDSPDWAKNANMKLFFKTLKLYSPSTANSPLLTFAMAEFQTVMNVRQVLDKLKPSAITSASIIKAFQNTVNETDVLGTPYSCKKPPISSAPGLCTVSGYMYKIENGQDRGISKVINPGGAVTNIPGF